MPTALQNFLKHLFTGKDNETFDVARVLWAVGVLFFLGLSTYDMLKGHDFRPMDWGTGLGLVLAGGGTGVAVKSKTEPQD
jgi:hypothetical protein